MRDIDKLALMLVGVLVVVGILNFGNIVVSGSPSGSKVYLGYQRAS